MKVQILSLLAGLAMAGCAAAASPQQFHAGISHIVVPNVDSLDAFVWYPTEAAEVAWQAGPFPIAASQDAPIAAGGLFPIILFSHGGGSSRGTPLVFRDLAAHLAREGFVVVAPAHSGWLAARPPQVREALDAVLVDPRFSTRVDPARMGMMGFSLGGAVTLILAGAVPDEMHWSVYCSEHRDDPKACAGVPAPGAVNAEASRKLAEALPLKALVLMDPLAALFDRDGLISVDMPTLLYRAERSDLRAEGNALALAAGLPRPPRQETTPGGHFVFIDPCFPLLEAEAPEACIDAPGVDRVAIHRQIEAEISDFLRHNL
jgi:predicted dienelactone hydrolase